MRTTTTRLVAGVTVATGVVGFVLTYVIFVLTTAGQRLDDDIVTHRGILFSDRLLNAYDAHVTVLEPIVLAAVLVVAVVRRRWWRGVLAAALPLVLVLVADLLKRGLPRPALINNGVDAENINTLPSGHVALAAGTVVAVLVVLPRLARPVMALVGMLAVAVVLVATIAAHWHRFSDGLAAVFLSVAGGALVVLLSPAPERDDDGQPTRSAPAVGHDAGQRPDVHVGA